MAEPLANTTVIIDANTDGVKKGVAETKSEINSIAPAAEAMSDNVGGAVGRVSGAFGRLSRGIGAVLGPIGALTTAFGLTIGALIRLEKKFNDTTEATKKAREQIVDLTRTVDREFSQATEIDKLADRFDALGRQIKKTAEGLDGQLASTFLLQLDRLLVAREKAIEDLSGKLAAERQKALADVAFEDVKRQQALREEIAKALADLTESALPEEEQIKAQYKRVFDELSSSLGRSILPSGEIEEYSKRLRKAVDDAQDYALEKARERIAKEEKAEKEKNERVAKAAADAMQREMDRVANNIRGSLGFSSGGLEDAIRALGTELQRRSF